MLLQNRRINGFREFEVFCGHSVEVVQVGSHFLDNTGYKSSRRYDIRQASEHDLY